MSGGMLVKRSILAGSEAEDPCAGNEIGETGTGGEAKGSGASGEAGSAGACSETGDIGASDQVKGAGAGDEFEYAACGLQEDQVLECAGNDHCELGPPEIARPTTNERYPKRVGDHRKTPRFLCRCKSDVNIEDLYSLWLQI